MGRIANAVVHALDLFEKEEMTPLGPPPGISGGSMGSISSRPPSLTRVRIANERSLLNSIISTIAVDVSDIEFRHAQTDEYGRYEDTIKSGLQYCFAKSANIDQAARAFRRDVAMTILHEGHAAIVPTRTEGKDPMYSDAYDVKEMRVGVVTQWYPQHVTVRLYNDAKDKGVFQEMTLPKRRVAIVENPFGSVMNEPNSILQRIVRKLNLLDIADEKTSNGKLDLIIQLPYAIHSDKLREEADRRRNDIEFQLSAGKYGIAYADSTEKITQLNRPVENNLWNEIEGLMKILYSELGITPGVMDGSADDNTMTNYMARTVEPIADAIAEEKERKFLSKTAVTQGQQVMYFRDPFKIIPITRLAEISDVLSRNEIVSPNELRRAIGLPPSKDPKAEQLHNSNMGAGSNPDPTITVEQVPNVPGDSTPALEAPVEGEIVEDELDDDEKELDKMMKDLGL